MAFFVAFYYSLHVTPRHLPSFPTRRSSDLVRPDPPHAAGVLINGAHVVVREAVARRPRAKARAVEASEAAHRTNPQHALPVDRKSTRLNSSHRTISYAVFCLKKKKKRISLY